MRPFSLGFCFFPSVLGFFGSNEMFRVLTYCVHGYVSNGIKEFHRDNIHVSLWSTQRLGDVYHPLLLSLRFVPYKTEMYIYIHHEGLLNHVCLYLNSPRPGVSQLRPLEHVGVYFNRNGSLVGAQSGELDDELVGSLLCLFVFLRADFYVYLLSWELIFSDHLIF